MSTAPHRARFLPSSHRTRIAVVVTAAVIVGVVAVQILLSVFVGQRVRDEVVRELQQQANQIARVAHADGYAGIAAAREFLPGTRVVVSRAGEVIYWSDPVAVREATATATDGDITVTLERAADAGVLGEWAPPLVIGGVIIIIGGIAWWIAARATRRLRSDALALACQAERVAAGDLDGRVDVDDEELHRVAVSLNAMTQELADADRRQREFLADVAHELRTPVTAIDGFAAALSEGITRTDEDRQEAINTITSESERLTRLVADLQALTLSDLNQAPVSAPLDLVDCCRDVVRRFEAAAAERGVLLRGPGDDVEPVVVSTNATHVDTILSNLTTNALRATSAGGTVRLAATYTSGAVVLSVVDTGVGIAAEHLPRIFDRMYRVDGARDRASGGSGLGLAIVKGLAGSLNARLEVDSAPGEGSAFRVVIPDDAP